MPSFSPVAAYTIAEVPSPASFEKTPLEAPVITAVINEPTAPPVTAAGLNAPFIIIPKTSGIRSELRNITPEDIAI